MGEKITETIVVDPERGLVLDRDTKSRGVEAVAGVTGGEECIDDYLQFAGKKFSPRARRFLAKLQSEGKQTFGI